MSSIDMSIDDILYDCDGAVKPEGELWRFHMCSTGNVVNVSRQASMFASEALRYLSIQPRKDAKCAIPDQNAEGIQDGIVNVDHAIGVSQHESDTKLC